MTFEDNYSNVNFTENGIIREMTSNELSYKKFFETLIRFKQLESELFSQLNNLRSKIQNVRSTISDAKEHILNKIDPEIFNKFIIEHPQMMDTLAKIFPNSETLNECIEEAGK